MAEDFMKIPRKEMDTVKKILEEILHSHEEEEGAIDCMARFYCEKFPNVSQESARELADQIMEAYDRNQ